jgi:phosphonoacetaldehyde hydrolase
MSFTYERRYRGKIRAALLDWAGTTMDYGCMAPAVVFVEVFKRQGVPITMDEARAPMGAHKRVHIKKSPISSPWRGAGRRSTGAGRPRPTWMPCSPSSCRSSWRASRSTLS